MALKILPEAFATDPDRLARFQREAQVLASLNHPGIAAIYGIEEGEGTRALVLELVEGPTLADRIAKGPIPIDEALPIAKQIAEALEAAHEAGVIHRDLKPANIKVREDGTVKVLDFGLAKALDTTPSGDPSESPTLTAAATQMGVIMGTAAYMSPEQARGKPVDKRADIWSFGVVLYEMLTGRRAFEGDDVSLTLADVMRAEPAWQRLPESLSAQPMTTLLTEAGDVDHRWPELLPEGRGLIFTVWSGTNDASGLDTAQIALQNAETGERRVLLPGSSAHYVPSGHLVFVRGGGVWAVPFDLERGEVVGSGVPVLDDVHIDPSGIGHFAVATNGTLVYRPKSTGDPTFVPRTLVWVDREGREEPLAAPARPYMYPRMSPDGTRVALDVMDQDTDTNIWLWDFGRARLAQLTFDTNRNTYAVWMPHGQQVIYRSGGQGVYRRAADGTGEAELLTNENARPYTMSADGTQLVLRVNGVGGPADIDLVITTVTGDSDVEPLLATEFVERNAEISPDGRWMAYESDESGQFEIYVRPFPDVNSGRWLVSSGSGTEPLWSPAGSEIFYRALDGGLMSVPVSDEDGFSVGNPSVVVAGSYYEGTGVLWGRMYDVSPDGQRFLMIKEDDAQPESNDELVVVQNWLEELKELVPVP